MATTKLDAPSLITILVAALLFAGGAMYIAALGREAEQDLGGFFSVLRWIMLGTATLSLAASVPLSRHLHALAEATEREQLFPPAGSNAASLMPAAEGEAALLTAARLRGYALFSLCFGILVFIAGLFGAVSL